MSSRSSRKKLTEIAKFLIIFNILSIPMYLVLFYGLSFAPLQNFLAFLSVKTLNAFGIDAIQENSFVNLLANNQLLRIEISFDSTGWKTMYALFALVVATPKRKPKGKGIFLLWGIPLLFVLNFLRIITTILVAVYFGFQYFDVVHLLLWREGLIAAVLALWYLWLAKRVK